MLNDSAHLHRTPTGRDERCQSLRAGEGCGVCVLSPNASSVSEEPIKQDKVLHLLCPLGDRMMKIYIYGETSSLKDTKKPVTKQNKGEAVYYNVLQWVPFALIFVFGSHWISADI